MTDAADIIPGIPVETHPWAPYIPKGARILFLGTFPPQSHRWAMEFYYPNPTNDFWRIMGLIFTGDPDAYYIRPTRSYRLDAIKALLDREGIALADTGASVQRLRGNASDAHLHIVKPVDLPGLLAAMPECSIIATTGEKAAATIASITGTAVPAVGSCTEVTIDGAGCGISACRHRREPIRCRSHARPRPTGCYSGGRNLTAAASTDKQIPHKLTHSTLL